MHGSSAKNGLMTHCKKWSPRPTRPQTRFFPGSLASSELRYQSLHVVDGKLNQALHLTLHQFASAFGLRCCVKRDAPMRRQICYLTRRFEQVIKAKNKNACVDNLSLFCEERAWRYERGTLTRNMRTNKPIIPTYSSGSIRECEQDWD